MYTSFSDYFFFTHLFRYAKIILKFNTCFILKNAHHFSAKNKFNSVVSVVNFFFDIIPTKKKINANIVTFKGEFLYVARGEGENGIRGYIDFEYMEKYIQVIKKQLIEDVVEYKNEYISKSKSTVFK